MVIVLVFALTLLLAVFVSSLAERSILSTAVLFLVAGFMAGPESFGWISPTKEIVNVFAVLALFSVLFTDAMKIDAGQPLAEWRLPGRALLFGLPLTLAGTALFARITVGLTWTESFLLGAILSPTDPVLVSAIVGREDVPWRLRNLLNVESGLNDGLALPVVVALLATLSGQPSGAWQVVGEAFAGVAIGIAIPWAAILLERSRFFEAAKYYVPLLPFAIGLVVLSVTALTRANEFLAAFAAGITIASISSSLRDEFQRFGENVTELLKLAALLLFGSLISGSFLNQIPWQGYVFAVLAIVVVRPAALVAALFGTDLPRREWAVAAWFGPKGFASVSYALLMLGAGIKHANELFHLAALVIAGSILAHSSTDVVVAEWLQRTQGPSEPE